MAQPERFEILILGSGKGGKLLAWEMARSGRRTAVVERRYIGGSCPNINMIGAEGGEVMAVVQTAMLADLPYPKAARRHSRASDDGGGPRLAVRECAASRCPTDHTKTDRPALMVRSRSDVRARYSLAEGGWAIRRMRVWVGLISLFSPRWARWARLVSKGFDHERNARRGCSQSGIAG